MISTTTNYALILGIILASCSGSKNPSRPSGAAQEGEEEVAPEESPAPSVPQMTQENVPGLRTGAQYLAALVKTHGISRGSLSTSYESVKPKLPTSSEVMIGMNADFWSAATVLARAACEEAYRIMSSADKTALNTKEKITVDLVQRIYPTHAADQKALAQKSLESLNADDSLNTQNFWKMGCTTLSATLSFL